MTSLPSIFEQCRPRYEVMAGELPDAIFAADLWDVVTGTAHADYRNPARFFAGTHPTTNLKLLVKDITERLAGVEGGPPVFRLETGFGGGKTHSLIAAVHAAREGVRLAELLAEYAIERFPERGEVRIAAFVGEESDPLSGHAHEIEGQACRTYTPWGQIALLAGGMAGYDIIRENDLRGSAPDRGDFQRSLGDHPVLIVLDELVLYMARAFALPDDHRRSKVNSQWATFLQTLFSVAARRPRTAVLLTLPSEQDANRRLTGELKQFIPTVLETVDELDQTTGRHVRNLTPTQSHERAAVLGRRLFEEVNTSHAGDIAQAYGAYYEEQRDAGVQLDGRAFEANYTEQIRVGYPFHPELIRLFAERLAAIPEFQATRGALRLVARMIRSVWDRRDALQDTFLLQPYHIDLTRSDMRDEMLTRLGKNAFERGLEADVVQPEGGTHASAVEGGWPWPAATESAVVVFLHSLPDGSRGLTPGEAALALGRPGCDLAYVARALEETERRAWYMRREGEHYLFRTRASVNKRYQERLAQVHQQPGEVRETLDTWIQEVYAEFGAFQIIPFPQDHTVIRDNADRLRLILIHYDTECGTVGGGDRLHFTRSLFMTTGVNASPRIYRNTLVFLLAESTRVEGMKDAVRSLIAWERVLHDIETEQTNLAQAEGGDFRILKDLARRGATGVPAEFMALENDLGEVRERLGTQEIHVRSKLLEAYRILAFAAGGAADEHDLFSGRAGGTLLECYRVDFGEVPEPAGRGGPRPRQAVAEGPILQCLRQHTKLVPEPTATNPVVLAPEIIHRPPIWKQGERCLSTAEVWDRLRREPELPFILRDTDLLPTFRAGLTTNPQALWTYYDRQEKKVYTRDSVSALAPAIAPDHLLYDLSSAITDRITAVAALSPQEIWAHLWPREGADHADTVSTRQLLEAARTSDYFPVMPERGVLWQALRDGVRENRWVLYLRNTNLAIGAQEMPEWPGTPRYDETTELWSYQAALDHGLYPRQSGAGSREEVPLTSENLHRRCWSSGTVELATEDLERTARSIWAHLSRPHLEELIQDGLQRGLWAVWIRGPGETFYTQQDTPGPSIRIGPDCMLVVPSSSRAQELDDLRPGRGPQPITQAGTPREVFTRIWETLATFGEPSVAEMMLTVNERDSFDNTLLATWADRPQQAQAHVTVEAHGQRTIAEQAETVTLRFEGRFEEVRAMLAPIWPFKNQGELDVTIAVRLTFEPGLRATDSALEAYRQALMEANQGVMEACVVPARPRPAGGT
jgi:hypothetical protein